jgi:hypothetical protein
VEENVFWYAEETDRVHVAQCGQTFENDPMDLLPNEQNFDLDKSLQKFHHSLKEHHKISNMRKFCCEML